MLPDYVAGLSEYSDSVAESFGMPSDVLRGATSIVPDLNHSGILSAAENLSKRYESTGDWQSALDQFRAARQDSDASSDLSQYMLDRDDIVDMYTDDMTAGEIAGAMAEGVGSKIKETVGDKFAEAFSKFWPWLLAIFLITVGLYVFITGKD